MSDSNGDPEQVTIDIVEEEKEQRKRFSGIVHLRNIPDWSDAARIGDHLWVRTSSSGDLCYVGDKECTKHGTRVKCAACHVIVHQNCIKTLINKLEFNCKPTFRDVGVRQYREQTSIFHHWVKRRSEKGKCRICCKSFQSKISFGLKETNAIDCSWCKSAYHNKKSCYNIGQIGEECNLGAHRNIIVPPSWIVKLPIKGSFQSSLKRLSKDSSSSGNQTSPENVDKQYQTFAIKPIPSQDVTPLIVFINPKSGGNQGVKLLQKFQWLLNPRQVFDLTQDGPKMGLDLFKKVPNLRVLACGGDGTVGWILSVIDQIGIVPAPPVSVLPLGTGNDLARALGWGGGYTDEPISKILTNIGSSDTILLDRWLLEVCPNPNSSGNTSGKDTLPLNVVNNYFSLGVDAHIALEFHEAREAHPEKFNSRIRNKMFYGQMGGKDLLKRKWKGLAEFVTLECDGVDLTSKLKELKVHAVVFLNISSYGGGTKPWNKTLGTVDPSTDDGLIEVVGLTTYQLPLLQAGGHGTSITQCKVAKIVTSKTIPMQVDGEACKLNPSIINLSLLNKAPMLAKQKRGRANKPKRTFENFNLNVFKIGMTFYEQHHHSREILTETAVALGPIEINPGWDLEQVRNVINKLIDGQENQPEWCFVDSCTAERFFRIDRAQEYLHYVSDICDDNLYILECDDDGISKFTEDDTAKPSPTSINEAQGISPDLQKSNRGNLYSSSSEPSLTPQAQNNSSYAPNAALKTRSIRERVLGISQLSCSVYWDSSNQPDEALLAAAKAGDIKTIKNMHTQGHSLATKDASGQSILHYASRYGHKDVVKYTIRYAPSWLLDLKDSTWGQTALHKAAAYKWRSICCLLISAGATVNINDNRGSTPKILALQTNNEKLALYLESQEHFHSMPPSVKTIV